MSLAALAAVLVAGRRVLASAGLAVLDGGADMDPSVGADIALAVAIVEGPADLLAALGQVGVLGGVTTPFWACSVRCWVWPTLRFSVGFLRTARVGLRPRLPPSPRPGWDAGGDHRIWVSCWAFSRASPCAHPILMLMSMRPLQWRSLSSIHLKVSQEPKFCLRAIRNAMSA